MNDPAIGIDLGTTHSLAAIYEDGQARVIGNGDPLIPSIIFYPEAKPSLVGNEAKERAKQDPQRSIFSVKRFIGKGDDLDIEEHQFPFHLALKDGLWQVRIGERWISPQEVSARILLEVIRHCERHSGQTIQRAVITVPAYFNDKQRQATKDAAKLAGVHVLRIINEPTAAALAYGLSDMRRGKIAVYDLGGGTFDLSILNVVDGVFRVLSTRGDTFLGGDDFDESIMEHLARQMDLELIEASPSDRFALRLAARRIKETLSSQEEVAVTCSFGGRPLNLTLTRVKMNEIIRPVVKRSLKACRRALKDAGLKANDIDQVILVGGSSRVPLVRDEVGTFFKNEPLCSLDPDHVVAMGAAVQAALIDDKAKDMLLMDVTPLSLGLETIGGAVDKLILRNTPVPANVTESFTTYVDNQTGFDFHVVQGERELVEDNMTLARFKLKGIPPLPAGMAIADVSFEVDADGILTVSAKEKNSGQEAAIEVIPGHGLDLDQVRDVVLDSIQHARDDIQSIRIIAARTQAQTLLMATKKALKTMVLEQDEHRGIESAISELEAIIGGKDALAIEAATAELNRVSTPLAERMVSQAIVSSVDGKKLNELHPETLSDSH